MKPTLTMPMSRHGCSLCSYSTSCSKIIVLSHYSTTAARPSGRNEVQVLATLFLLSYAKLVPLLSLHFNQPSINTHVSLTISCFMIIHSTTALFRASAHPDGSTHPNASARLHASSHPTILTILWF